MDNSKWAFAPDTPDWPIDAQGEKEKAVLLTSTFDSTADAALPRGLRLGAFEIRQIVARSSSTPASATR